MKIKEIMRNDIEVVYESTTLFEAARKMRDLGIGAIPVRKGDRLVGMVTDRDIVVRGVANGADPREAKVSKCMTSPITYAFEDQELEEAAILMEEKKIRRLPILNNQKRLVGVLSISDLGAHGNNDSLTGEILRKVVGSNELAEVRSH